MSLPTLPTNFILQQANSQALLTWDIVLGATSYDVQRSIDGVTYASVSSPTLTNYLDTSVVNGTQYFYKVAGVNGDGTGPYTNAQSTVPCKSGDMSLGELRLRAQQRADQVGGSFVTTPEWNSYINQSYFELYDLLTTLYEDYYTSTPILFTTVGGQASYTLPNGTNTFLDQAGATITPRPFYKLQGVDLGVSLGNDAWMTVHKYDFIERNRYVYPNVTSTYFGVFNLRYRVLGDKLTFIPSPSGGQYLRVWYIPRLAMLLRDTDIADGVNGWIEYVIVDAAIKAMQKEESDVTVLVAQKMTLKQRIEESAANRDAGSPDTISNSRSRAGSWGPTGDGSYGGW